MTDRQKHEDASMKALKGRLRSSSLLGKDSNTWNSGTGTQWQLAQYAGKRCYQYSVCELAHTHTFPNTHGLGNFSLLHFCPFQKFVMLPCQQSVQKASLGSAFTISSPGRGLSRLPWLHKRSELSQQDHFLSAEVHDLHSLKMPSASYSATISHLPAWHMHPITQADRENPNHWITDWRANQESHKVTKSLLLC